MKIDFENSTRRLSFLCRLPDIKIAWINLCPLHEVSLETIALSNEQRILAEPYMS